MTMKSPIAAEMRKLRAERDAAIARVKISENALMNIEHATADARKACAGDPLSLGDQAACDAYDIATEALAKGTT